MISREFFQEQQANVAPERKGKVNSVSFASDTFLERTGMREREK